MDLLKAFKRNDLSKVANSGNEAKNVFPSNPDDLLPEISRNKITKPNGKISQTIYTSDGFRIRAERHALLSGEVYNLRHHGVHYHLEYKVDLTKSWNNKNNVHKFYPNGVIQMEVEADFYQEKFFLIKKGGKLKWNG
jgi:hypothetical protein